MAPLNYKQALSIYIVDLSQNKDYTAGRLFVEWLYALSVWLQPSQPR